MEIEIGKTYKVSNKYKKSYVEIEELYNRDTEDTITYETGWRSGTWEITPQDSDEVEMLKEAMEDDYDDTLYPGSFNESEMIESWDGCWDDWDFSGVKSKSDEELEEFQELVQEEGVSYLLDNGYDTIDTECYFSGPITVEEVNA
jgi:hypothetical protein